MKMNGSPLCRTALRSSLAFQTMLLIVFEMAINSWLQQGIHELSANMLLLLLRSLAVWQI